jgi:predicted nuclease of predicted toxin-antitoxin system
LRFLLDENVSPVIGKELTKLGHDVLLASSACRGSPDEDVVALAITETRILISEDKDFGDIAFRDGVRPPGLIRLVLPKSDPEAKAMRLCAVLVDTPQLLGGALVVEHNRTRFRRW